MPNRTIAPDVQGIDAVRIHQPEQFTFRNGLTVCIFRAPEQELIKAEFVFNNVFEQPENSVRNTALSSMLKEGTSRMNSGQIADAIDFYGAYLVPEFSFDHNALTLYTLRKHAGKVLPIVHELLTDSVFPQQELDTFVRNNKQNLQISLEKTDFLARRKFYQQLFGDTRYGRGVTVDLLDSLDQSDLLRLYRQQVQPKNGTLFLSGNITHEVLETFRRLFEEQWENTTEISTSDFIPVQSVTAENSVWITKDSALQSSLRLGKIGIQRIHPDYPALQFVNTLLGGFFGSRLMNNIREDKGYTYGIGSMVASLRHTGFISIVTDVGCEHTDDTIHQIEKEIKRLQEEKVDVSEIELVQNYMLGSMLGSLESVFSHVDKFKSVYFSGLDLSYYNYYTEVVQGMDADQLIEIAQRYLNFDELVKVAVGNGWK
ncbi:MAG: M16 family metallopeptidase [Sphingobacterium sp.]